MLLRLTLALAFLFCSGGNAFSQLWVLSREDQLFFPDSASGHTFLKPYDVVYTDVVPSDSLSWFRRKLFRESLVIISDSASRFHFTIDPLVHFQLGKDMDDSTGENLYRNSRGFTARGRIGTQFFFETSFLENQSRHSAYQDSFALLHGVIPGMGRWKSFDTTAYDYAWSSGCITWQACSRFSLQAGHGKHFAGEGYRSLLLSDNAFNYPYLRLNHHWGKFRYTNVYAMLMNLHGGGVNIPVGTERLFQKKPMVFHTLSWKPVRRAEIALFQGMIWNVSDSLQRLQMGVGYFLPVIFAAPAMYDLNTDKNTWTGFSFSVEVLRGLFLYGQFMLDATGSRAELKKSGFQAGVKYANAFTLKNLFVQAEFNRVDPFTYAHRSADQNISHYNQPLTHPLGAGFSEAVGLLDYKFGRLLFHGQMSYAKHGQDVAGGNAGYFIWASDSTANTASFIPVERFNAIGYVGYLINPAYHFQICAGMHLRKVKVMSTVSGTTEIFISLRTLLWNQYFDF